jgi:hypothetical protein
VAEDADGKPHIINPKKEAGRISIFEPRSIAVAAGEQLLIRRNHHSADGKKLINGELVTVSEVDSSGRITLYDGRILPPVFKHYTHGYAVTSQSAQGKTVDRVLVAIDALSAHSAVTSETLYVAASRGRERCTIYTDDRAALFRAFQRSGERKAALDFVNQHQQPHPHEHDNTTNTNAGLQPTAGVSLQQSLHPTGMPSNSPGSPVPALCHPPGCGTGLPFGPLPGNPLARDHQDVRQDSQPVCGLPGSGGQLPDGELLDSGYERPQTTLAY